MIRPAWPESYKRVVKKGEDIRHIVRNATLKAAIEAERNYQLSQANESKAAAVMGKVAQAMGAEASEHSFDSMMNIYKRAYLNLGNLFPGAGAINRAIGLTADRISTRGLGLVASNDFAQSDKILKVFDEVSDLVESMSDQMERQASKFKTSTSRTFLADFDLFRKNILYYLDTRGKELAAIASRIRTMSRNWRTCWWIPGRTSWWG